MRFAAVRHKPEQKKLFWFTVPENLSSYVNIGSEVICNTKLGSVPGIVENIIDGYTPEEHPFYANKEFKNIISVKVSFRIEDIHIPWDIQKSQPGISKITERIEELYNTGRFHTRVYFTPEMSLIDGYTAYLVAKMFGHEKLEGYCMAEVKR